MNEKLTDTGKFNAIQESIDEARREVKEVKGGISRLFSLIIGLREADISAESAKLATLKGETKNAKSKYTPE